MGGGVPAGPASSLSLNAVQKASGVWRVSGGQGSEAKDVPAVRSAAVKLEQKFEDVMKVLDGGGSTSPGGAGSSNHNNDNNNNNENNNNNNSSNSSSNKLASSPPSKNNDLLSIQATVDAHLAQRRLVCMSADISGDVAASSGIDAAFAESIGINMESFAAMKETLSSSIYTQKHTDLVLGELVGQIEVACLEQGRLLRTARERYASSFQNMSRLHSDTLWQLETAAKAILELRSSLNDMVNSKEAFENSMRSQVEASFEVRQKKDGGGKGRDETRREGKSVALSKVDKFLPLPLHLAISTHLTPFFLLLHNSGCPQACRGGQGQCGKTG